MPARSSWNCPRQCRRSTGRTICRHDRCWAACPVGKSRPISVVRSTNSACPFAANAVISPITLPALFQRHRGDVATNRTLGEERPCCAELRHTMNAGPPSDSRQVPRVQFEPADRGNVTRTQVPPPVALARISTRPRLFSAISRTIARPRPEPSGPAPLIR